MADTFKVDTRSFLFELEAVRPNTQSISRIASSYKYCRANTRTYQLADALTADKTAMAVAVVDDQMNVVGIVIRKEFLTIMVRPYARDVFRNDPVSEIMQEAATFFVDANIFSVAEGLGATLQSQEISYFVLEDRHRKYAGVFSTQDMLVYLSNLTTTDIQLARQLQARIVKEREFIVGDEFEFVGVSNAAKGVGGDYYEIRHIREGKWIVALCDVSGKGVAASIVTATIWGMMNMYDFSAGSLADFVSRLNESVVHTFESEKFVTGIFLIFDEHTRNVTVCDMGHSHIFLLRRGSIRRINTKQENVPIGIISGFTPRVSTFNPLELDTVFVLTDGLTEQKNEDGNAYNLDHIGRLLSPRSTLPVELLADDLLKDFHTFRGRQSLSDDVTFVLLRFQKQEIRL